MSLRSAVRHVSSFLAIFATLSSVPYAQSNRTPSFSASEVAAELINGRLNPADSKMGDTISIQLKEDVRSNGEIDLNRGTTITGVIRNVKPGEATKIQGQAQSMIQIEWFVPPVQARSVLNLSFALESVSKLNPVREHSASSDNTGLTGLSTSSTLAARSVRNAGTLLDSPSAARPVLQTAGGGTIDSAAVVNGRSNVALLSMPSVIAVDRQTSATVENTLGITDSGQLFRVGHSQFFVSGGSKQSLDLYSHLKNDTVIACPNGTFEISSGTQLQMLVGVNRK